MIQKLLLIRKNNSRSSIIEEAGLQAFVKGEVLKIAPQAWHEEAGISHYGFVLSGLKLDDLAKLQEWIGEQTGIILLDHSSDITTTLASVGLQINQAA